MRLDEACGCSTCAYILRWQFRWKTMHICLLTLIVARKVGRIVQAICWTSLECARNPLEVSKHGQGETKVDRLRCLHNVLEKGCPLSVRHVELDKQVFSNEDDILPEPTTSLQLSSQVATCYPDRLNVVITLQPVSHRV